MSRQGHVPRAPGAPRTVLFLHSSTGRYGADRQLALLASGLDPERYRALVVLPGHGALAADLRSAGVEVLARPLSVLRRNLLSPTGLAGTGAALAADTLALTRLIRARDVALVHSNTSVTLGGATASRMAGVPHVWHVREIYAAFPRAWPAYRRLLAGADRIVCISEAVRRQFPPAARTVLLRDGVAVQPGVPDRDAARSALGLPAEAFVCAVLGRISSWKGQDVLARALAEPSLSAAGAVGLVAGDAWPGQERHELELDELARRLDLGDRFRRVGFRDDPATLYAAADAIVVPSTLPEPLGDTALEAGAAGRCVVASAHGGLLEIVEDGVTGRLVEPGDPRALAAALSDLAADPTERDRLAGAARERVASRYGAARLLADAQALYDEVLSP